LKARDYKDATDLAVAFDEMNFATTAMHQTLRAGTPQSTGVVVPTVQTYPIDDGREIEKHQNGSGIGNDGDPAYTLDRSQHSSAATVGQSVGTVRRLTPTECERLQGFPDGWTAERIDEVKGLVTQADSARYKQMGNAVAVPCVEWIVNRLVAYEQVR
jgi:site-specific DNA-cytosine methylase